MEKIRCAWCGTDELYQKYHDEEWGKPVYDDETIFEFLVLESFQAGLSWITILRKRENFRKAFDNFDYQKIANYPDEKVEELMQDAGIIRNRLKILATISNAQKFIETQKEFGSFSKYIWDFIGGKPIINLPKTLKDSIGLNVAEGETIYLKNFIDNIEQVKSYLDKEELFYEQLDFLNLVLTNCLVAPTCFSCFPVFVLFTFTFRYSTCSVSIGRWFFVCFLPLFTPFFKGP